MLAAYAVSTHRRKLGGGCWKSEVTMCGCPSRNDLYTIGRGGSYPMSEATIMENSRRPALYDAEQMTMNLGVEATWSSDLQARQVDVLP
ncbi:hypothetical protein CHU98_g10818 [Xylaria longipes]|nr:hypothetical protein CHU98_g10818 [Xylaria longipes]